MARNIKKKIEDAIERYEEEEVQWNKELETFTENVFFDREWFLAQREKSRAILRELRLLLE